jgi:hypothetical protein
MYSPSYFGSWFISLSFLAGVLVKMSDDDEEGKELSSSLSDSSSTVRSTKRKRSDYTDNEADTRPRHRVFHSWLRRCRHLVNPQFQGLDNLQTVGGNWMFVCDVLTNPQFQGLDNLHTVGDSWLQGCDALANPKFQGLTSLQNVGEFWMSNCPSLRVVDLRGLKALETVGHSWMKPQETSALSIFQPLWGERLQAFQTCEKKFWNGLG